MIDPNCLIDTAFLYVIESEYDQWFVFAQNETAAWSQLFAETGLDTEGYRCRIGVAHDWMSFSSDDPDQQPVYRQVVAMLANRVEPPFVVLGLEVI